MAKTEIAAEASLDTTKFQRGLAKADKGIKGFTKSALRSFGAIAGAAGLGSIANSAINAANEITNLSRIAGVGAVEFQEIAYASEQFGISQEKVADILKDVNDKVGDFMSTGAGPMKDFFENIAPKVGVTAEQFKNLSGKDALQLYVSSLEKANVTQSEMTFYMEAIANDATALTPLFAENGAELQRLSEEAQKYGQVMDDLTRQKLKEANQTLDRFQRGLVILGGTFLTKAIPAVKIFGNGLGFAGEAFAVALMSMNNFFSSLGKSVLDVLQPAILGFKALSKGIEGATLAAKRNFSEAKILIKESLSISKQAFEEIKNAPKDIASNFKVMSEDVGRDFSSLGNDLEKRSNAITENVKQITGQASAQMVTAIQTAKIEARSADTRKKQLAVEEKITSEKQKQKSSAEETLKSEGQLSNIDSQRARSAPGGTTLSGFNAQAMTSEQLQFHIQDLSDKMFALRESVSKVRGGNKETMFAMMGGGAMQKAMAETQAELMMRKQFAGQSQAVRDLLYDPYTQDRLVSSMGGQSEFAKQTEILTDIKNATIGTQQTASLLNSALTQ